MHVVFHMLAVCHQHEIFNSIVGPIHINMVDHLMWFQQSANMIFHNQYMLVNVWMIFCCPWVIFRLNQYVTTLEYRSATLPVVVIRTGLFDHLFSFIPRGASHEFFNVICGEFCPSTPSEGRVPLETIGNFGFLRLWHYKSLMGFGKFFPVFQRHFFAFVPRCKTFFEMGFAGIECYMNTFVNWNMPFLKNHVEASYV